MDSQGLLEWSKQLRGLELGGDLEQRLTILADQIQVLRTDEAKGSDPDKLLVRCARLEAALRALDDDIAQALPLLPRRIGDAIGAILAFRFPSAPDGARPLAPRLAAELSRAFATVAELEPGIPLRVEAFGGAADAWVFISADGISRVQTLRSCYLLGLLTQRQLSAEGEQTPAFLLDWDEEAARVRTAQGVTVLSQKLRDAQEVLLGSRPGHILVSDECHARLHLHTGKVSGAEAKSLFAALGADPGQALRQDVEELRVLTPSKSSLALASIRYTRGERLIAGSATAYVELTAIEHREQIPGRRRGEPFIQLLATHDECVIIGATNEHLAENYLKPALQDRQAADAGLWRRIVVIFPSTAAIARLNEDRPPEDRLQRRASGLRSVISFLRSVDPTGAHWKVAEYEENLPFVGNWMSGGPRNSIRLSPLLPGSNVDETFVVELPESTAAYAEALKSFVAIERKSSPVGEWNLLGTVTGNRYLWSEIASRSDPSSAEPDLYEAVVLIMVHGMTSRGPRVYLQLRSNLNGSSALGTYSNISGKVTVADVYAAAHQQAPQLVSPDDGPALMSDLVERGLLRRKEELPREVWVHAAIREVDEELGLQVDESRLMDHGQLKLRRADVGRSLYFRLFSLELRTETRGRGALSEIQKIRRNRVGVGMDRDYSLRDILGLADKGQLNALLAANLDTFLDHYRNLRIADE